MLILKRKIDEEIKINSEITVKILGISDNQVKIGISAPKDVSIYRGEIFEKVKENLMVASKQSSQRKKVVKNLSEMKINKIR